MSYFVYILISKKDSKLYVGCSNRVESRFVDHNSGKVFATKDRRPLEILYTEGPYEKAKAFNKERYYKSLWSARFKKKLLLSYINKVGRK